MTVLGGGGAWPTPHGGCSGYLVEYAGYRLLVDPGYATISAPFAPPASQVDAVFISHGHGDHCADLNPLLRVRHLSADPLTPLPVYALPGAVGPVLNLDSDMHLDQDCELREFDPDTDAGALRIGPFTVHTMRLAHFVDNVGVRIEVDASALAYTGDGGADPAVAELADRADVLLVEASYVDDVPPAWRGLIASARDAGAHAKAAEAEQVVLTHLFPGTDPAASLRVARGEYDGPVGVTKPGMSIDILG